jgi:hypothetical protein
MFILNGYVFDKRLQYSYTVSTAAGAASIVVAGNIGWRFSQALTITGGYNGAPGVRTTFPFFNSDGVLTFSTGAFAPGVTLDEATDRLWAIDGGIKWNGLAINGEYYFRWLNNFAADGPLPLASTFDNGFELSAGQFVIPQKLMVYGRGSKVFGQFGDPWEYAGGVKWHFLPTERLWLSAELMRVKDLLIAEALLRTPQVSPAGCQ